MRQIMLEAGKFLSFNSISAIHPFKKTECIHITVSIPPPPPGRPETTQFPYEIVQIVVLFSLLGVLVFIYVKRKK